MRVPAVKIIKQGELQRDMWSMFLANVREPWERIGDLNAQVSSLRTGDARLNALIGKYGRGVVEAGMAEMQNHSERLVRAALRVLPDGVYQAVDQNDEDFTTGLPVTIRVTLTIEGDHAIFDLSESDDAAKSSINASIVSTTSSMFTALGAILPPMPMSAGIMRAVEVRARPGSVVYAQMPSPVSTQASTMEVTMSVGMVALSQALPERGAGSCSTILNTLYGGFDDRPGFESSFLEYLWGVGGMGGTKYRDGPNVVGSAYTATLQNIPVELQERRYPLLWLRFMVKPDSGGPGRSRGGLALDQYCAFPFLEEGTLTNFGGRNRFGPPGIFGGRPGGTSGLVLNEGTERQRNEGFLSVNIPVRRRETLSLWSAGGGGYGDPLERPPARVIEDIQDEYVTIAGARGAVRGGGAGDRPSAPALRRGSAGDGAAPGRDAGRARHARVTQRLLQSACTGSASVTWARPRSCCFLVRAASAAPTDAWVLEGQTRCRYPKRAVSPGRKAGRLTR